VALLDHPLPSSECSTCLAIHPKSLPVVPTVFRTFGDYRGLIGVDLSNASATQRGVRGALSLTAWSKDQVMGQYQSLCPSENRFGRQHDPTAADTLKVRPFPYPFPIPFPVRQELRMIAFDHERLDVYQAAIDFVALADDLIERLPRGRAYLADQLQRAATSIPLNIAEGAGEFSRKDKARFYRIALRSATECAALLDVCRRLKLADNTVIGPGRDLLVRIVSMLTKMAVKVEPNARAKPRSGSGTGTGTGTGTASPTLT
jgi:four helix bundle protein